MKRLVFLVLILVAFAVGMNLASRSKVETLKKMGAESFESPRPSGLDLSEFRVTLHDQKEGRREGEVHIVIDKFTNQSRYLVNLKNLEVLAESTRYEVWLKKKEGVRESLGNVKISSEGTGFLATVGRIPRVGETIVVTLKETEVDSSEEIILAGSLQNEGR